MYVKLSDMIETVELTTENLNGGSYITKDKVIYDSLKDVENINNSERIAYATDYAVMNGACLSSAKFGYKKQKTAWYWLRTAFSDEKVDDYYMNEGIDNDFPDRTDASVRAAIQLNLSSYLSTIRASRSFSEIGVEKIDGPNYNTIFLHTLSFGEYPKRFVGNTLNPILEREFNSNILKATGKKWSGYQKDYGSFVQNEEFEYEGKKFVRVLTKTLDSDSEYSDGTKALDSGTYKWVMVEPITWRIRNWDEMPKTINRNGNGTAEYIDLLSEECITSGVPFSKDGKTTLWKDSTIREFLNTKFLQEVFEREVVLQKNMNKGDEKIKTRKGYGIVVENEPLTIEEQIKFYFDNRMQIMLHGASDVGKSERIGDTDPDYVSIVLRNGILPEEIIGKTIYYKDDKGFGNKRTSPAWFNKLKNNIITEKIFGKTLIYDENKELVGKWCPPHWYVQICEKCEKEPNKNHVLFIDEITNVRETEQSIVYSIILDHTIGKGYGPLPENCVVIAAGNNKEESSAAYGMPETLFRRYVAHIYIKSEVKTFIEYANQKNSEGRNKIHPIVALFVGTYGNKVLYTKYDDEEPPKFAIDNRGWKQVSDIIYANKGVIRRELLENKIGTELSATFLAFAKNPPLIVDDIVQHNYTAVDIPTSFDAKYALALSLLSAEEDEIKTVRNFVKERLDKEILATFDSMWVGKDNERAILINQLDKQGENATFSQNYVEIEKKKITLEQFWDSLKDMAIHCETEEKAKILTTAFDKMGKKWGDGSSFLEYTCWDDEDKETCYFNGFGEKNGGGSYSRISYAKEDNIPIYEFSEVDFSGVLTSEEVMEIEKMLEEERLKKVYNTKKITLNEFWDSRTQQAIHCETPERAKILLNSFDKIGKKWSNDISYLKTTNWSFYKSETCYYNGFENKNGNGSYGNISHSQYNNIPIYEFSEVDFSGVLISEEIMDIEKRLEEERLRNESLELTK